MKISHLKTNLQSIITKLSLLQTYRDNLTQDNLATEYEKIAKCKIDIEEAFNSLESEQIAEVVNKLKKRKAKRIRQTKKIKALKIAAKSLRNQARSSYCTDVPEHRPTNPLLKRKAKDAQKYLAIMDSLEVLHELRSEGDSCNLSESLNYIRATWEATAEMARQELRKPPSIDAQWRQALFGDSSKRPTECGLKGFIERRLVWDSYIVADDDPRGSCIPMGWVCPKESARSDWMQYRV